VVSPSAVPGAWKSDQGWQALAVGSLSRERFVIALAMLIKSALEIDHLLEGLILVDKVAQGTMIAFDRPLIGRTKRAAGNMPNPKPH